MVANQEDCSFDPGGSDRPPAGLVIDAALILGEEVARREVCDPYPT